MGIKQSKIAKHPVMAKLIEKKFAQGYSLRQIAKSVNEDFKIKLSHQTIKNYLDKKIILTSDMMKGEEEFKESLRNFYNNLLHEMNNLDNMIWEQMNKTTSVRIKLRCASEIRKNIAFRIKKINKFSELIDKKTSSIPLHIRAGIVSEAVENLEKSGYIQRIKPINLNC